MFTLSLGQRPAGGFSDAKAKLDRLMAEILGGDFRPWRTHDLRRTLRTRLASLRVPDVIAEAVLGHGKRGLQRVYDQHSYEREIREALTLWASKLRDIVELAPENAVKLEATA